MASFSNVFPPLNTPLNKLEANLLQNLQNYRCLIILDDIHHLFASGKLAGEYQPEYQAYNNFFKKINTTQSCLLLIGWEAPLEFTTIKPKNFSLASLTLNGLEQSSATKFIEKLGGELPYNGLSFVDSYQGNPLWLEAVVEQIAKLGISVNYLVENNIILLPEIITYNLTKQFERLTTTEQKIMLALAQSSTGVTIIELSQTLPISLPNLSNALQSLLKRCLVVNQAHYYSLSLVIKQYIADSNC